MRSILIGLLLFSASFSSLLIYESGAFLVSEVQCPAKIDHPSYFSDVFAEDASAFYIDENNSASARVFLKEGGVVAGELLSTSPLTLNVSGLEYIYPLDSISYYVVNRSSERVLVLEGDGECTLYRSIPSASWRVLHVLRDGKLTAVASVSIPELPSVEETKLISGTIFLSQPSYPIFAKSFDVEQAPSISETSEGSFYYSYDVGEWKPRSQNIFLFEDEVDPELINKFTFYLGNRGDVAADAYIRFTPSLPIPKGRLLFFEEGVVAGLPSVSNLPAGKETNLHVGKSFNVIGSFTSKLAGKAVVEGVEETSYDVEFRATNFGKRKQEIELHIPLSSYSEVRDIQKGYDVREEEGAIIISTSLMPGETKEINFTFVQKSPWRPYP